MAWVSGPTRTQAYIRTRFADRSMGETTTSESKLIFLTESKLENRITSFEWPAAFDFCPTP